MLRSGGDVRSWQCRGALLVALVLFAAGCDWTSYGYGNGNTHYNPTESAIGVGNVASLQVAWTTGASDQTFSSSPAIANGLVYIGASQLYAYSANGSTGCSGTPKTCSPVWYADPSGGLGGSIDSSPAVKNGVVYVGFDTDLYAYDAKGSTGCTGSPKLCEPLWTASAGVGRFTSSPKVVNGVVYAGADDGKVYAFDAAGSTGCSGSPVKTCAPLWTAATGGSGGATAAVVNGVVYVGADDGKVYAFDAAGSTGCSGTPVKTCAPLWTAATGGPITGAPAVTNGVVYVGAQDGKLYAFDALGSTGCSGGPKTCVPLWTADVGVFAVTSPAVANGVVFIGSDAIYGGPSLQAFDANGSTGCSGTPKTCVPLWGSANLGEFRVSSPAVANGVVFIGGEETKFYAFRADGAGCSGCSGLWSFTTPQGSIESSPAVANGFVYVGSGNGTFYAFHL
jgi:outer membrane protein assembly factor BamB